MAQPTIVKCPPPCAWSDTGRCAISNEVQGIAITHPDRVIWPQLGITKLELARYIGEVGEWMLPQVANRPLTLLRCPGGAGAKCFYQRQRRLEERRIPLCQLDSRARRPGAERRGRDAYLGRDAARREAPGSHHPRPGSGSRAALGRTARSHPAHENPPRRPEIEKLPEDHRRQGP